MKREPVMGRRATVGEKASRGATGVEETPVAIRSQLELGASLKRTIRAGLGRKLGPHAARIERVTVRLVDLNGPRGGADDISCEIKVVLAGAPSVVIKERGATPAAAFDQALPRIARVLRKDLGRRGGSGRDARRAASRRPAARAARPARADGLGTARRNLRKPGSRMTAVLEDSASARPSRKSTRKSANRGKTSQGKERTAVAKAVSPQARRARARPAGRSSRSRG
jgi:ribosome-associated translation inhibitor RaiA